MKTKLTLILFLIATAICIAATLTVDIPANDVPRVSEAFGNIYQLGRNATINEVSFFTRQWIISQTKAYERQKYNVQYVEVPLDMQPTPTPTPTSTPTPTATPTP